MQTAWQTGCLRPSRREYRILTGKTWPPQRIDSTRVFLRGHAVAKPAMRHRPDGRKIREERVARSRFKTGSRLVVAGPRSGHQANERASEPTRTERADEAARESACWGVRGAKPLGVITDDCAFRCAPHRAPASRRSPAARSVTSAHAVRSVAPVLVPGEFCTRRHT